MTENEVVGCVETLEASEVRGWKLAVLIMTITVTLQKRINQ